MNDFEKATQALQDALPVSVRLALLAELELDVGALDSNYDVMRVLVACGKWSATNTGPVCTTLERLVARLGPVLHVDAVRCIREALQRFSTRSERSTSTSSQSTASTRVSTRSSAPDESRLCVVCSSAERNALLRPCRHAHMCVACATECLTRTGLCPTCRARIAQVEQIYV